MSGCSCCRRRSRRRRRSITRRRADLRDARVGAKQIVSACPSARCRYWNGSGYFCRLDARFNSGLAPGNRSSVSAHGPRKIRNHKLACFFFRAPTCAVRGARLVLDPAANAVGFVSRSRSQGQSGSDLEATARAQAGGFQILLHAASCGIRVRPEPHGKSRGVLLSASSGAAQQKKKPRAKTRLTPKQRRDKSLVYPQSGVLVFELSAVEPPGSQELGSWTQSLLWRV